MTYSIFGPSPILATEALLLDLALVVLVVNWPPMTTAGGLGEKIDAEQVETQLVLI